MPGSHELFSDAFTTAEGLPPGGEMGPRSESRRPLRWTIGLAIAALSTCLVQAEDEIEVGHDAAGRLKVAVGFEEPLGLPVSVFPGYPGYATGEVGFHSAAFNEPTNDFFQVSSAADIRLILVAKDPGMEVLNDHGSAYMQAGESFFVGTAPFDTHPLWNLVNGTPGKSSGLTFVLRDLNGVYTDSDPFELSFMAMPPLLSITPAAPGFITLSWTPADSGLVLQSSPDLSSASWTNAPSGATNPVTVPVSSPARFYRVYK